MAIRRVGGIKTGRALWPSPIKNSSLELELEFDSEACVERTLVARVGVAGDR